MLALAALLMLASAQADPFEAQQRSAARQALEQLVAQDEDVHQHRGADGEERIGIGTRPRASTTGGMCELDRLEIRRDKSGAIRKVETVHRFLVVAGRDGTPRWDLKGEALEKRCAAGGEPGSWFTAGEIYYAEAAVVALLALKEELLKPDPSPDIWICRKRRACPDPRDVGKRIDPLDPRMVSEGGTARVPCPEGLSCVSVSLDISDCGGWVTQLRLETDGGFRFHSARAGWQVADVHCGVPEEPRMEG